MKTCIHRYISTLETLLSQSKSHKFRWTLHMVNKGKHNANSMYRCDLEQPSNEVSIKPPAVPDTKFLLLCVLLLPHLLIAVNNVLSSPDISDSWIDSLCLL